MFGAIKKFFAPAHLQPVRKKTGPKGPQARRTPAQVQALEDARYIRGIKRTDPARYQRLMDRRLGIVSDDGDEESPVGSVRRMMKEYDAIAKIVGKQATPDPSMIATLADTEFGKAVGENLPMYLQMFGPLLGGLIPKPPQKHVTIEEPTVHAQITPAPVPVETPIDPVSVPTPTTEQAPPAAPFVPAPNPNPVKLGAAARIIVFQLERRNPKDAAAWLMEQAAGIPAAKDMVTLLADATDEELVDRMLALDSLDAVAGLGSWFYDRYDWSREVIAELRRLAPAPVGANGRAT